MKKILTFSLMALMALFAVSCSQDDITDPTPEEQGLNSNDDAYISVNVQSTGSSLTRGTTDKDYEYGTAAEQAISSVRFFFYDSNNTFLKEGLIYSSKDPVTGTDPSVELIDQKLVLVVNIQNIVPSYVVTVVNAPSGFTAPAKIDDFLNELQESYAIEGSDSNGATKYFTMTTSSYFDQSNSSDAASDERRQNNRYFVTKIPSDQFKKSADDALNGNALDIYVERLAVKVTVGIDETNLTKSADAAGQNIYQLLDSEKKAVHVEGDANNTDVYIELRSWDLNALAKKTNLVKHLDTSWSSLIGGFNWNNPSDHRSFWGMSYNYGSTDNTGFEYPVQYTNAVKDTEEKQLRYITGDNINTAFGSSEYCNENNNVKEVMNKHYRSAATSVLVLGLICDSQGKQIAQEIVNYAGKLYTAEAYADMVVNNLTGSGTLSAYNSNGTQISGSDCEVVSASDKLNGRIYVQLKNTADVNKVWYKAKGSAEQISLDDINLELKRFNMSSDALGYKKGWMYYSIPIEHLGAVNTNYTTSDELSKVEEGYFGIIRNHHYKLTINALSGVGHGIVDPDEPIVPNPVDDGSYYLNAKINILSWKVISQNVSLK